MKVLRWVLFVSAVFACSAVPCRAQQPPAAEPDTRTQFPPLLRDGFFGISLGAMDSPFSASQLSPGFRAADIRTPGPAFQITLLGKQFNQYFSGEMTYTRPVQWVRYDSINGSTDNQSVWVVLGEFKLRGRIPLNDKVWLYGEAGVAVTSRHGAETPSGTPIVESAHYPAFLTGGGVQYQANDRWSFLAGFTRSAGSRTHNQPRTLLFTGGVRYYMRPLPADQVAAAARGEYPVRANSIHVDYGASMAGFGLNTFFSSTLPIFWKGNLAVDHGFRVRYERNLFHTARLFALDLGVSGARWHGQKTEEHLASVSIYPLLRFFIARTPSADVQFTYSLAGPTILFQDTLPNQPISLNGQPIGTNWFSFQDLMGVSVLAGKDRRVSLGLGIGHYSNGNLFPINAGVAIPLTLSVGYAF